MPPIRGTKALPSDKIARHTSSLPRPHVTIVGWLWLLIFGAVLALGVIKKINLLMLLASPFLALWFWNALLAGLSMRGLRGKRTIMGPIFAQDPFVVHVAVTNHAWFSRLGMQFKDQGPAHHLLMFAPRLRRGHTEDFLKKVILPDRGLYPWGRLQMTSGYPLGLVQWRKTLVPPENLIVLPRMGRFHLGRFRRFLRSANPYSKQVRNRPQRRLAAQTEFHGLRAFRSGDSPKWIHWRTTARRGELMVREFEDVPGENLVVVVDPLCDAPQAGLIPDQENVVDLDSCAKSYAQLDQIISLAATICWAWQRHQGERLILAVAGQDPVVIDSEVGHDTILRMLERLAVEEGNVSRDRKNLLDSLAKLSLPRAPVLFLAAAPSELEAPLAQALNRPVTQIVAADLDQLDFYEKPGDHRKRLIGKNASNRLN
jgi:uncharacterized protein (DUF58 family)